LEIGQASASISEIVPAAQVVDEMMNEFYQTIERMAGMPKF
jgi:hypothetical protein